MEWTWWQKALACIGAISAMVSIIPLMVLGGTSDWRRALQALRQYLAIMGTLVAVVGGLALVMAIAEHGVGPLWAAFTRH